MRTGDAAGAAGTVSVVIPTLNEGASILACLESVLCQTVPAIDVLVVDGGSSDATLEIVRRIAGHDRRVRVISNPRRSSAAAMNIAVESAQGEWLVRVDGHSVVNPTYVATAVDLLRSGCWGGVGGRKTAVADNRTGRAIAAAMGSRFGVGSSRYHYVTSAAEADHVPFGAYPVTVCRELGGWDEDVSANEDFEFDFRLRESGRRLVLDPRMQIEWRCRETLAALGRQYWRYGRGKAMVARKHPGSLRASHVAPPALVCASALGILAWPKRAEVLACIWGAYAAALLVASAATAHRAEPPVDAHRVGAAFATMHFAWGAGFVADMIRQAVVAARGAVVSRVAAHACTSAPQADATDVHAQARRAHGRPTETRVRADG